MHHRIIGENAKKSGTKGVTAIGMALKTNSTLATLSGLEDCEISGNGCAAFCDSLREAALSVVLSELLLNQNTTQERGAETMQTALI